MARRAGKSSTRRARQRRHLQHAPRPAAPQGETAPAQSQAAADAPQAAATSTSSASPARPAPHRGRAADPRFQVAGPSRLTERAIAEYHYVQRDLRNIGVLVVIMVALLAACALLVNLLGIGQV
jgi:hypothetical protein